MKVVEFGAGNKGLTLTFPKVIIRCLSSTVQNIIIIEQIQFVIFVTNSFSQSIFKHCTVHEYILAFTIH